MHNFYIAGPEINGKQMHTDAAAEAAKGYTAVVHDHGVDKPCSDQCTTYHGKNEGTIVEGLPIASAEDE